MHLNAHFAIGWSQSTKSASMVQMLVNFHNIPWIGPGLVHLFYLDLLPIVSLTNLPFSKVVELCIDTLAYEFSLLGTGPILASIWFISGLFKQKNCVTEKLTQFVGDEGKHADH